jgi:DNA-binding NarL/FixJ family response regulator
MTTNDIRLVLVDDHEILRDGLRKSFEAAGVLVVGEAGDGLEGVDVVRRTKPDVVLMDLTMPALDGIEATRRILESDSPPRIVMLTMHDDVASTRRALEAGAVGYLSKGTKFRDVLATVRDAASGDVHLSAELADEIMAHADDGDEPLLSERQIELLQVIADGQSTKQAARTLGISPKTAHNHLNAIYRRLEAQSLTHAVLGAIRLGLIDLGGATEVDE